MQAQIAHMIHIYCYSYDLASVIDINKYVCVILFLQA